MNKLTRKQHSLRKAQTRFEKVSKRRKQFQVQFDRKSNSQGKFKTKARLVRSEKMCHGNNRGILHKIVNAKYRVTGDVPSVTRTVNSIQPTTFKGKALKRTAQTANRIAHDTVNTVVHTGLAAETAAIRTADDVSREIVDQARRKYTREAIDDYHRGTFAALRIGADAVKGTKRHFKLKKQYRLEKAKYRLKKADYQLFQVEKYQPEKRKAVKRLRKNKADFKEQKAQYQSSEKSNLNKAHLLRRKQMYQQEKRELKFRKKELSSEKKHRRKSFAIQKKIKKDANPGFLLTKPVKYTGNRMKASAWQKTVNADSENDVLQALDSAKRRVITPAVQKASKPQRLQRERKKRDRISEKEQKSRDKLQRQDHRLKEKHNRPQKKKKIQNQKKHRSSVKERFKEGMKAFFQFVKNIYEAEVKKFFAAAALFLLVLLLVFAFILMIFSSITSGGGFTLGTYAAQDYDLSEAEKYYTKLAWEMNNNIKLVGDSSKWKNGLKNFGVNTRNMKDNPDTWYWGNSSQFNWEPCYDFDPYKLWCFLCAYYYNFDAADNGDITYWKYSSDTETLLQELFDAEYQFVYWYDNTSRWEEYSPYHYWGGGSAETGTYYRCEKEAYIYDGRPYRYRFKPIAITNELGKYRDSDGYLCIDSNYRVLNPNDNYELTGFYVMDHRYYSGTKEPFYYYDNATGNFFFMHGTERHDRSFWGWNREDAWFLVSPTDTEIWNSNIKDTCMYGYYEKYYWKTDCRLYYSVKQKKTFDQVISDKLNAMSHASERSQYYQLLLGNDSGQMYGNHQTLRNIFGSASIHEYTAVNGFGYDMQAWNTTHCNISDLHESVDFVLNANTQLYAPFDCKITEVDSSKHTVVLRKNDVEYWYDGSGGTKRDTEVYLSNVTLINGLAKGDTLKEGEAFAVSTGHQSCDSLQNSLIYDYVHIKVKIDTDGYGWDFIDPRLVLY